MDEQEKIITAYKEWFISEHGKLILKDLSVFCLENRDIFDVNCARKTDFNLGAHSVMRHIRYMLERKTEPKHETVISEREIL